MSEGDDNTSISLCPNPQLLERVKQLCRKSGEEDCSCSVVSKVGPKTMIKCHCGASYAMYENRLQNAEKHHSAPSHTSKSKQKRSAKRVFSNFFKPSHGQNAPIPSIRKQAVERPCVGLNDTTWHRPKARPENSISAFSERSLLRERGAPPIDKISYEITGKKRYS
ncbi:hypothetical protein BKA69DRAFT_758994 [Paraphysoderma sedebokerense]|nr:hypothetical protein BKA69DRAFT_758994 [Paraphysoderma sedebokerense]